jgi:hypothetical protein
VQAHVCMYAPGPPTACAPQNQATPARRRRRGHWHRRRPCRCPAGPETWVVGCWPLLLLPRRGAPAEGGRLAGPECGGAPPGWLPGLPLLWKCPGRPAAGRGGGRAPAGRQAGRQAGKSRELPLLCVSPHHFAARPAHTLGPCVLARAGAATCRHWQVDRWGVAAHLEQVLWRGDVSFLAAPQYLSLVCHAANPRSPHVVGGALQEGTQAARQAGMAGRGEHGECGRAGAAAACLGSLGSSTCSASMKTLPACWEPADTASQVRTCCRGGAPDGNTWLGTNVSCSGLPRSRQGSASHIAS